LTLTLKKGIKVSIDNLSDSSEDDYRLFVHCRSIPLYFGKISKEKDVILSYDSLSQGGIYSFQLLDTKLNKVAERLKFVYPEKELCPISVRWTDGEKLNNNQIPCVIKADSLREGETMDVSVRVEYAGVDNTVGQSDIISHLLFDMDKAGKSATERASFILKSQGFNIRVLQFDEAKDPDEYLKKNGREAFLEVVQKSLEIFDFLYELYSSEYDLTNIIAKQNFIERFKEFFAYLTTDLEKEMYLKNLSEKIDINIDILRKTLVEENKKKFIVKDYIDEIEEKSIEKKEFKKANNLELSIVEMLLKKPKYYEFFKDEKFESDIANKTLKFFEEKIKENFNFESNNLMREFENYIRNDNESHSEYINSNIARIILNYVIDTEVKIEEKNFLKLFKDYFRFKVKLRDKTNDDFQKIVYFSKFKDKIEKSRSVEEFIEIYNSFKYLF